MRLWQGVAYVRIFLVSDKYPLAEATEMRKVTAH